MLKKKNKTIKLLRKELFSEFFDNLKFISQWAFTETLEVTINYAWCRWVIKENAQNEQW